MAIALYYLTAKDILSRYGHDKDIVFIVNYICDNMPEPVRALAGLRKLLDNNHEVRTGSEIDMVCIDGQQFAVSCLKLH